ncbi:MAG: nitroreductase family protein [Candidatus Heimdallarchaeota archaeon]|nr:nitroreductase family protein [Candidatus Heimdallarchaeota archaeon]
MVDNQGEPKYDPIPFVHDPIEVQESISKSLKYFSHMDNRRSIRFFSDKAVPFEIIENIIKTASTAPSGAHIQPWTFVVVKDPSIKKEIRNAAEKEEKFSYETRMTEEWLRALTPIGTDWEKPFLETVPYLIIVFKQRYGNNADGSKKTHYYVNESVGIAVGFLISAIHNAGLCTLTHTPSPMKFLTKILDRPENEVPFILLPVGYPAEDATVPNLSRKSLDQVMVIK